MNDATKHLPEFEHPPVTETILGVEFEPISGWGIPHFGLYWGTLREDYPNFAVHPVIGPSPDEVLRHEGQVRFEFESDPNAARCWYVDATQTRLIQVQSNRFLNNWRKMGGDEPYPRYDRDIRPRFEKEWKRFCDFVTDQKLGQIVVKGCEVTYINQIDSGEGWEGVSHLHDFFPLWSGQTTDGFLPKPLMVDFMVNYPMAADDPNSRLSVRLVPVMRVKDQSKLLQLKLTAKAKPSDNSIESVMACLDRSREWVVRGFADVTSKQLHGVWKRKAGT